MNCKKLSKALLFLITALVIVSCSKGDCDLDHIDKLQGLPALKAGTFPEEDLTLNVGEQYVYAPKASSPLDIYYQWYQNGEDMSTDPSFTFNADSTFIAKVGQKSMKGSYSYDASTQKVNLKFAKLIGMNAKVNATPTTMDLLFESDKLLKLITFLSSKSSNSTLKSIGSLANSYDGMMLGFSLQKL